MFFTALNCNSQNQTKEEIDLIKKKLSETSKNGILNYEKAYVIDSQKNRISYDDFLGEWLLIDFWSTGCRPCIKEFPALSDFYKENKGKINVIAVSVDSKFERYKKSAEKYKIGFPHYFGGYTYNNPLFNLNIKIFQSKEGIVKFRTQTPQYVLISPKGHIVDKDFPKPSSPDFQRKLQEAFENYE